MAEESLRKKTLTLKGTPSKSWRTSLWFWRTRSVLDCGSPLPLLLPRQPLRRGRNRTDRAHFGRSGCVQPCALRDTLRLNPAPKCCRLTGRGPENLGTGLEVGAPAPGNLHGPEWDALLIGTRDAGCRSPPRRPGQSRFEGDVLPFDVVTIGVVSENLFVLNQYRTHHRRLVRMTEIGNEVRN